MSVRFVIGMLLLCWVVSARSSAGTPGSESAVVDASLSEVSLIPRAQIVKDAEHRLTAEDILGVTAAAGGSKGNRILSFGFSGVVYWFSFSLNNPGPVSLQRLLVFEPTWLDDVKSHWFYLMVNGKCSKAETE